MKGRGTTTNRMILGGRFLVSEHTSTIAAGAMGDIKMDAMSIYGFDRRTNEYTIVELDSMGTYWVTAAGAPREDKSIVMSGETARRPWRRARDTEVQHGAACDRRRHVRHRDHLQVRGPSSDKARRGASPEDQVSRYVEKTVVIDSPADVVWHALTDAEELTRWFPVDARVKPGLGSASLPSHIF